MEKSELKNDSLKKGMNRAEILDYIQLRASGKEQAPNYDYQDFYNEMIDMVWEQMALQKNEQNILNKRNENLSFIVELDNEGFDEDELSRYGWRYNEKEDAIYTEVEMPFFPIEGQRIEK